MADLHLPGAQYRAAPAAALQPGLCPYTAATMARPLLPWLLGAALLLGTVGRAWSDAQIEVRAHRTGDLVQVQARATLNAPWSVVWGTLTDYERLPEFIPGLRRSRIVARQGAMTTIEQSGEARFLFLTVPIEVTLEATERGSTIEVRRIAGSLRHLQGRYETQVFASDPSRLLLRWVGSVAPQEDLPPLIAEALIRLQIEAQFVAMVQEIERRELARRQALPAHAGRGAGLQPAPSALSGQRQDQAGSRR